MNTRRLNFHRECGLKRAPKNLPIEGRTAWELGCDVFGKASSDRTDLATNRKAILKEKLDAKQRWY